MFSLIYLVLFLNIACNSQEQEKKIPIHAVDSISKANILDFPLIKYYHVKITDKKHLEQVRKQFAPSDSGKDNTLNYVFLTLNRKERRFLKVGDSIIIPSEFNKDIRSYSIFPHYYEGGKNQEKVIFVSNKYQSYACYEYGKLVRFAAANTGKEKTPTYPGRYALVWRDKLRLSSLDSTWKMPWTWNFHQYAGNAFHQFDMPGYAASHSCIRQFPFDAKWLFDWGKGAKRDSNKRFIYLSGTPVIILDNFDFTRRRTGPWVGLNSNKDLTLQLPNDPLAVEEALIPISQIPKESRGSIPNRHRLLHAEDTLRARGIIRPEVKLTESKNFNKLRQAKKDMNFKKARLNQ